jgi:Domain of unknown function (DUF4276)
MTRKFGIIAEDESDVDVIVEILCKYFPRNAFSVRKFIGRGCGKIKNKCDSWTRSLFESGCDHVFIFHDLDRNVESNLRNLLEKKVSPSAFPRSLVVIPIEELEAWLLSDASAIKKALSLQKTPKKISNCELINSPKEFLGDLIWKIERKRYINTIHNN